MYGSQCARQYSKHYECVNPCNTQKFLTQILISVPHFKDEVTGTSLAVQWLRLQAPNAGGMGVISGKGSKISHAMWHGKKKKKRI